MSEINVEVQVDETPVVEIVVDENSAQTAIDAAAAAQAALEEMAALLGFATKIITNNGLEEDDNVIAFAALWVWKILGIVYSNTAIVEVPIPLAPGGMSYFARVVGNQTNGFELIAYEPSAGEPTALPLPDNFVEVLFLLVTDSSIGDVVPPPIGDIFQSKAERKIQYVSGFSEANVNNLLLSRKTVVVRDSGFTNISKIYGFTLGPSFEFYSGANVTITNSRSVPITLVKNIGTVKVVTIDGEDLVLKPGESGLFFLDGLYRLIEIGKKTETLDLSGDLQFAGYPSTRNDGPLPHNKVLSTDINGNLKLHTIATMQPPHLRSVVPDSYRPFTTGDTTLYGSNFIDGMSIVIPGLTIHNTTYVSDNEYIVNGTRGAAGSLTVTLNNGLESVWPDAILIVDGTVSRPNAEDWEAITGAIDISQTSKAFNTVHGQFGSARWSKVFDHNFDYTVKFNLSASELGPFGVNEGSELKFAKIVRASDNVELFSMYFLRFAGRYLSLGCRNSDDTAESYAKQFLPDFDIEGSIETMYQSSLEFRNINGHMYCAVNNEVRYAYLIDNVTEGLKFVYSGTQFDLENLMHIQYD